MSKVTVYGTSWCPDVRRARQFLDEKEIAYDFIDIDEDQNAEEKVLEWNDGRRRVPTILVGDEERTVMSNPSRGELEKALDEAVA